MCWNDPSGRYHYDRCCDIYFGPKVRALPAFWTRKLELEYGNKVQIVLGQSPVPDEGRNFSWDPNGVVVGPTRSWTPLYGVVWEDRAGRVMLDTTLLRSLYALHKRPLRTLDIASGLGLNPIAAAKTGLVDLAVGIDADAKAVIRAKGNIRRNGAHSAHVLHFDACNSPETLDLLLHDHFVPGADRIRFDVFTMSSLNAPPRVLKQCIYELIWALGGPFATYIDSDGPYFGPGASAHGTYPFFDGFARKRGFEVLSRGLIDVGDIHGTDEVRFLAILPVQVWYFTGRDFPSIEQPHLNASLGAWGKGMITFT